MLLQTHTKHAFPSLLWNHAEHGAARTGTAEFDVKFVVLKESLVVLAHEWKHTAAHFWELFRQKTLFCQASRGGPYSQRRGAGTECRVSHPGAALLMFARSKGSAGPP